MKQKAKRLVTREAPSVQLLRLEFGREVKRLANLLEQREGLINLQFTLLDNMMKEREGHQQKASDLEKSMLKFCKEMYLQEKRRADDESRRDSGASS